ncbi:hypothetical protein KFK09_007991 [Dendrobium nobile]|uniref:Uncharacterized protein n=1 Tax=Dendrobium nobile TaxID=94219 RepID=A0A8T3BTC8_DENNO|nr:hypothetical protein KFK09_007991 [Dendrobium nobile]
MRPGHKERKRLAFTGHCSYIYFHISQIVANPSNLGILSYQKFLSPFHSARIWISFVVAR